MVQPARKRTRDYSAERARRNAEARLWGFSSLDQMSKARKAGEFPSRAALAKDPSLGMRAKQALEDKDMQAFDRNRGRSARAVAEEADSKRSRANAAQHDEQSALWAAAHSKQTSTRFNKRWSAAKKERYYQTFVRPWGKKRTSEQRDAYYSWQLDFAADFTDTDNPYV